MPARDRTAMFCDGFARHVLRVSAAPLSGHTFKVDMGLWHRKNLTFWSHRNTPLRIDRTREMLGPRDDGAVLVLTGSNVVVKQFGEEEIVGAGEAVMFAAAEPVAFLHPGPTKMTALLLSRDLLGPLFGNVSELLVQRYGKDRGVLPLLQSYVSVLRDDAGMSDPSLQDLAVTQFYDLVGLLFGGTRDAAEMARVRGLPAAHLHAIKKEVLASLGGGLSLKHIAARHRITPRYVRMLFENEGTSFTGFVREERLKRARRILANPRHGHRRIADVAFAAGFNNVSYFHRAFRERFGLTPADVRTKSRNARF